MLGLEYFSFSDLWSPVSLVVTLAIAIIYLGLTGKWRTRFPESQPVSTGKKVTFLIGLALYYLALAGPVNLLAHLMFSAHMTAMVMAFIVAPPLMLLGIPGWMLRPLLNTSTGRKIMNAFTHPLAGLLAFNMLFSFYHMPAIHDYVMTHYTVHNLYYLVLTITSFMMWWPVAPPIPELNPISSLKKMGYVFANGVLITPACALIIFAGTPIYATYNDPNIWAQAMGYCVPGGSQVLLDSFSGPEFFSVFSPLDDQQFGGVIMKLMQEVTYGAALAYIFFHWYMNEKAEDDKMEPDPAV